MIFNPFWITLTKLLVVPGTSSTSPVPAHDIYIYIYIYKLGRLRRQKWVEDTETEWAVFALNILCKDVEYGGFYWNAFAEYDRGE